MQEFRIQVVVDTSSVNKSVKQVEHSFTKIEKMAGRVSKLMHAAFAVTGIMIFIQKAVQLIDTFNNMQNRMRVLSKDIANLDVQMNSLFKIANATRTAFETTAEVYTRTALATREMGLSFMEVAQFTKSVNQAVIISGTAFSEAHRGLIQFSQGLAKGRLDGDELRAVLEQLPVVADVIARELGVTRGEIRDLGAEGKITADVMMRAFANAREELDERFGRTIPTISQAFQIFRNDIISTIGALDKTTHASAIVAKSLVLMAKHIGNIVRILVVLGVTIATVYAAFKLLALSALITQLYGTAGALGMVGKAFIALRVAMATHPFLFLAATTVAATTAAIAFADKIRVATLDTKELKKELVSVAEQQRNLFVKKKRDEGIIPKGASAEQINQILEKLPEWKMFSKELDNVDAKVKELAADGATLNDTMGVMAKDLSVVRGALSIWNEELNQSAQYIFGVNSAAQGAIIALGMWMDGIANVITGALVGVSTAVVEMWKAAVNAMERLFRWIERRALYTKRLLALFTKSGDEFRKYSKEHPLKPPKIPEVEFGKIGEKVGKAVMKGWQRSGVEDYIRKLFSRAEAAAIKKRAKEFEGVLKKIFEPKKTKTTDSDKAALGRYARYIQGLEEEVYLLQLSNRQREIEKAILAATRAKKKALTDDEKRAVVLLKERIMLLSNTAVFNEYIDKLEREARTVTMSAKALEVYNTQLEVSKNIQTATTQTRVSAMLEAGRAVEARQSAEAVKARQQMFEAIGQENEMLQWNTKEREARSAILEWELQHEKAFGEEKTRSYIAAAKHLDQLNAEEAMLTSMRGPRQKMLDDIETLNRLYTDPRAKMSRREYLDQFEKIKEGYYGVDKTAEKAIKQAAKNAEQTAKQMEQAFRPVIDGLTDAFIKFAETGKFAVKDMVRSISADLMRASVRRGVSMMFGAVTSAAGGGASFAGSFAQGGAFMVGGTGGTDSQLVSFRATPGERVEVATPRQQQQEASAPQKITVVNVLDEREALHAMNSTVGQQLILNTIERNPAKIRRIVGR